MMNNKGQIIVAVIVFGGIAVIALSGFIIWSSSLINLSLRTYHNGLAFSAAEAGVEYYRWHLAHGRSDYEDGTGHAGLYTHNYYDKNGTIIGQFILDITPPPSGSMVVTIKSTGHVSADPTVEKIIKVKLAVPSVAKYAILSNSNIFFTTSTEIFGTTMANGGIRFDGTAHNLVSSAQEKYKDSTHSSSSEFGVHTHRSPSGDPFPPASVPDRPDVFMAGRNFPVPAVDFNGITQTLANLKTASRTNGYYLGPSKQKGYELVFVSSTASTTFSIYKVKSLIGLKGKNCKDKLKEKYWGSWSINQKSFFATGTVPINSVIFVEDDIWVSGQVASGTRVAIAAGKLPDNSKNHKNITVTKDFLYSNYNGGEAVSMIAQNNFNIGFVSSDNLRIDGAIVAQHGRVGRYYYPNSGQCAPNSVKSKITTYGMLATNQSYGFSASNGTGYKIIDLVYDSNLMYSPPPYFQNSSDQYAPVSWDEIK